MNTITKPQREIMEDIRKNLSYEYQGENNRNKASQFISTHIDELRVYNNNNNISTRPSAKQKRFIKHLQEELDIKFEGKTCKDAWEWISEWLPYLQLKYSDVT